MNIGKCIKQVRICKNISIDQLCEDTGFDKNEMLLIEDDTCSQLITIGMLTKICKRLDITVCKLIMLASKHDDIMEIGKSFPGIAAYIKHEHMKLYIDTQYVNKFNVKT